MEIPFINAVNHRPRIDGGDRWKGKQETQAMGRIWLSARRRKILLLCTVLGLGGYGSYRIYRSVSRRRSLLSSLGQLIEAFSLGIESTSLVAGDVKCFLFSDEDDVPRSLKQSLKLMQCKEFQDALASFSASVSKGVITSVLDSGCSVERSPSSSRRKNSSRQGTGLRTAGLDGRRTGLNDSKTGLDGRRAGLDDRKAGGSEDWRHGGLEDERRTGSEDKKNGAAEVHIFVESREHVVIGSGADQNDKHVLCEEVQASTVRAEGLPERVMQKLFTDAGKGFASAVLGSVAKNATLSFLEGLGTMKNQDGSSLSSWEARSLSPDVCTSGARMDLIGRCFELASSSKGRGLLGEWIQVFVGTAVSVYLDKTKDVNVYEEIVAGVTNPSYQPAAKDLLTSVCNGAVETLVRTSHEVLSAAGSAGPSTATGAISPTFELGKPDTGKKVVEEEEDGLYGSSPSSSEEDAHVLSDDGCLEDTQQHNKAMILVTSHGSSKISLPNWVDGLSRTLAVPSNRRLLIDVAGTVTSEAIHSFFEVFLGIVSPYLQTNLKYLRHTRSPKAVDAEAETTQQDSGRLLFGRGNWLLNCSLLVYRDVVAKSQLIMTICFCILLHALDLGALEIA